MTSAQDTQAALDTVRGKLAEAEAQVAALAAELDAIEGRLAEAIDAGKPTHGLETEHASATARLAGWQRRKADLQGQLPGLEREHLLASYTGLWQQVSAANGERREALAKLHDYDAEAEAQRLQLVLAVQRAEGAARQRSHEAQQLIQGVAVDNPALDQELHAIRNRYKD
jgi:predicted  nucleic acid-binding Zn-ribbon protein